MPSVAARSRYTLWRWPTSKAGSIVFGSTARAPFARTRSRSSSTADAVSTSTTVDMRLRMRRVASTPSMTGMWMSISTRSGAVVEASITASRPFVAQPTTSIQSRLWNVRTRSSVRMGWSSAIKTLSGDGADADGDAFRLEAAGGRRFAADPPPTVPTRRRARPSSAVSPASATGVEGTSRREPAAAPDSTGSAPDATGVGLDGATCAVAMPVPTQPGTTTARGDEVR